MGYVKRKDIRANAQIYINPAHAQTLLSGQLLSIDAFYLVSNVLLADCEGPDQIARSRSLIWAFRAPKAYFRFVGLKCLQW